MEFKGTLGPWSKKDWINDFALFDKDGNFLARVDKSHDADLMSAAPELLEQLIRLRDIVANYLPEDDDHLDVVDAAINKALGG